MADNTGKSARETLRETIQLERELIREKIREVIEARYAKLEEEAARIAPDFDYENEGEKLKAEEAEELAKIDFMWADEKAVEAEAGPEEAPESEEAEKEEAAEKTEEPAEKKEYGPLPAALVSPSKYPKPPYVPKSAAGRALFGDRHRRVFTAAVMLMAFFALYQAWDYLVPKTVYIDYLTFEGVEHVEYATTARTAGAVMEELTAGGDAAALNEDGSEVRFSGHDILETTAEIPVSSGMTVNVRRATESTAKIAGENRTLWLVPGTVEENLAFNGISYDEDDEIKPAPDKTVSAETKITVDEVHYVVEEKTETVEAIDRVILDPSLTSGVQETTEGNDGEGVFTYTTRYVNGEDMGTEREVKEWITEPHDNILRLGTSATGNSGEYIVVRTFIANTTAYTARPGAGGALGLGVHVGTCAVDPNFVSLRSELWIEGYGYAFANDTGGAVKGNVVDLFMNSTAQCIRWGRRNMTAYVIIPAE